MTTCSSASYQFQVSFINRTQVAEIMSAIISPVQTDCTTTTTAIVASTADTKNEKIWYQYIISATKEGKKEQKIGVFYCYEKEAETTVHKYAFQVFLTKQGWENHTVGVIKMENQAITHIFTSQLCKLLQIAPNTKIPPIKIKYEVRQSMC